jgi:hypothetical protein
MKKTLLALITLAAVSFSSYGQINNLYVAPAAPPRIIYKPKYIQVPVTNYVQTVVTQYIALAPKVAQQQPATFVPRRLSYQTTLVETFNGLAKISHPFHDPEEVTYVVTVDSSLDPDTTQAHVIAAIEKVHKDRGDDYATNICSLKRTRRLIEDLNKHIHPQIRVVDAGFKHKRYIYTVYTPVP